MGITSLKIKNFRSIKSLDVELGETTVFIGPNNAGKTAILDAIRIALTRRWGQRGTGFTECDVHLASENDDPKASAGIEIEVRAELLTANASRHVPANRQDVHELRQAARSPGS